MPVEIDLFGAAPDRKPDVAVGQARGRATALRSALLVTNHPNMMYMLASGMILPLAGFGGKHYRDPFETFPGWIPLFVRKAPDAALRLATSEASHLRPVIAVIRLENISGSAQAIDRTGLRAIRFPDEVDGGDSTLLIPAPLPLSRIEKLVFPSAQDRKAFADAIADYGNVPLRGFRNGINKTLFAKASRDPWPPPGAAAQREVPLAAPSAAAGVMAMLLHVAHRGELAVHACRQAFDPDDLNDTIGPDRLASGPAGAEVPARAGDPPSPEDSAIASSPANAASSAANSGETGTAGDFGRTERHAPTMPGGRVSEGDSVRSHSKAGFGGSGGAGRWLLADEPTLAGLADWMRTGVAALPLSGPGWNNERLRRDDQQRLYWQFVERLVERPGDGSASALDVLVEWLGDAARAQGTRSWAGLNELRESLHALNGLKAPTAGELFARHETPFARAMILFGLRRTCAELLDFEHAALREADWLAAAILFGARDGWLGLPVDLRTLPGLAPDELQTAVSYRMARLAHTMAGADLDLGACPARIRPLRELFGEDRDWGARERAAALELSRAHKWDCIRTRVTLAKGEHSLVVHGGRVHIDVVGEPSVVVTIDRDRFYDHLASGRLAARAEARARKLLR